MREYTVSEVAQMLDKSEKTIRRMYQANKLNHIRRGNQVFILLDEDKPANTQEMFNHKQLMGEWEDQARRGLVNPRYGKPSEKTMYAYKYWLDDYFTYNLDVSISGFLSHSEKYENYATKSMIYNALQHFIKFLINNGHATKEMKAELAEYQPIKKGYKPRRAVLTESQVQEVFKFIQNHEYWTDYQKKLMGAIAACILFTGLRNEELCNLTVESLDLAAQELTALRKGGYWQVLGFNQQAADKLREYLGIRLEVGSRLFVHQRRLPISPGWLRARLRIIRKALGFDLYPHALRATFCTNLVQRGVSIDRVSKAMGHKSLVITQIYVRTSEKQLVEDMKNW